MNALLLLLWLAVTYAILFLLRFTLAGKFQVIALLIFNRPRWGQIFFNALLLPGVIIHELSHFLMAALLGVRTGDINIFPHQDESGHRLGSVQIAKTDPLRESLIGAAPMLVATISLVALIRWQFPALFAPTISLADPLSVVKSVIAKLSLAQTWLWFYLIFAISNTMFTSKSDRRAWPFMLVLLILLAAVLYGLGVIKTIQQTAVAAVMAVITQLTATFSFTIALDLLILAFFSASQAFLSWVTGKKVL